MANQISSALPGIFQNAFMGSLLKSSTGGGTINSLAAGSNFGLTGGVIGGTGLTSSNPNNPLQGATALSGLDNFVGSLMMSSQLRKAGLAGPVGVPGGAGGLAAGGGADPAALLSMIQTLMSQLQSMSGQGGAPATGGAGAAISPFAPAPVGAAPQAASPIAAAAPQAAGGGGLLGSLGGGISSALSAAGRGIGGIFQKIGDGFASIDGKINQAVGGILGALPLAKL